MTIPVVTINQKRWVLAEADLPTDNYSMGEHHLQQTPSPWIEKYAHLVAAGGNVLDLACGNGRHTRLFLERGYSVTAVDCDLEGVSDLATSADVTLVESDLENTEWPLTGRQYDAVVVCNYLHRPLLNPITESVAPGGLLLYDTFAVGNERFGRPKNPNFLLRPNELLDWTRTGFVVSAYQHGQVDTPRTAVRQSICAVRTAPAD